MAAQLGVSQSTPLPVAALLGELDVDSFITVREKHRVKYRYMNHNDAGEEGKPRNPEDKKDDDGS
ncbi:MAG: hypothetical protein ACT4N8_03910 [Sphingosinicella sp.]|uniref:hypothetical protein n=1 Tax=Sphingosinicella sp. TaxID=1917971 RepID=UPI004037A552